MDKKILYNYEQLVEFRHDLHQHPELSFQEVRTSSKIVDMLKSYDIKDSQIRIVAKTGLIVDIIGKAKASGKPFCVAFRADMDALPIKVTHLFPSITQKEENPEIDYCPTNGSGHMCGHDMHVACLLGGAAKFLEKINNIPCDKTLRLLFQPAEENLGGAFLMIQEGALIGVDEVYGMHNWHNDSLGKILCKPGYMLASATPIAVRVNLC
jgi:amidohydrolase